MEIKSLLVIAHLLGVVLGMGGAYTTDLMLFTSIKDKVFSKTEVRFIKLGSMLVWIGLTIIIISGLGLFALNMQRYLGSSKFLAKMTIVGIILINGIIIHAVHLPVIVRHTGHHFPSSDEFHRRVPFFLISGAVSAVSWLSALVLGVLHRLPYSYLQIISVYGTVILTAVVGALVLKNFIFPSHRIR